MGVDSWKLVKMWILQILLGYTGIASPILEIFSGESIREIFLIFLENLNKKPTFEEILLRMILSFQIDDGPSDGLHASVAARHSLLTRRNMIKIKYNKMLPDSNSRPSVSPQMPSNHSEYRVFLFWSISSRLESLKANFYFFYHSFRRSP